MPYCFFTELVCNFFLISYLKYYISFLEIIYITGSAINFIKEMELILGFRMWVRSSASVTNP